MKWIPPNDIEFDVEGLVKFKMGKVGWDLGEIYFRFLESTELYPVIIK